MMRLWTCPKCKRKFAKKNQVHSCRKYTLDKHFENKEEIARPLFNELKAKIEKTIGPFRVESLPCCIHFATNFSFVAVYALKDKIRIHFSLDYELKSPRIDRYSKMSANRYLFSLVVKDKKEIDQEFLDWLSQAYHLRDKKTKN